jgi:hypothetical protein
MPVILTTQEAEIRKIAIQNQPGQIVCETLSQDYLIHTKTTGGVAQGVGPEFKTQHPNTTRGLDFEHMIKALAHKGGVRIGKTPKKLVSICCP